MRTKLFLILTILFTMFAFNYAQEKKNENFTAKQIIDKYLNAIGGKENLKKITDIKSTLNGTVSGVKITIIRIQKYPDKFKQIIKAGNSGQTIKYDGKKAIMSIAGGGTHTLTGTTFNEIRNKSFFNYILRLDELKIKLKYWGKEKVNKNNTNVIQLTYPTGETLKQYYDVKTGLKIKSLKYIKSPNGDFPQNTYYDNYKIVEGFQFPFSIEQTFGVQDIEFKVSSIKINSGIKDSEFNIK